MFKHKRIALVLLMAVFVSAHAYGEQTAKVSGTVTKIDAEGGVIYVQTAKGEQIFFIVTESDLYMSAHHMSSIEITKGDPVVIHYVADSSGKKDIVRLVDYNKQNA